jgi:hypothetical protein
VHYIFQYNSDIHIGSVLTDFGMNTTTLRVLTASIRIYNMKTDPVPK